MFYEARIGVRDIYRADLVQIPAGYVQTGEFRPPRAGEMFMAPRGGTAMASQNHEVNEPRIIILRNKAKKRYLVAKWEVTDRSNIHGTWPRNTWPCASAETMASTYPDLYSIVEEEC